MGEHPDSALVRRGYDAFGRGDMDALAAMMTSDCVHHVPGDNPFSGHHKGRDACIDLYRRLHEETGGTMRVKLDTVLADGRGHAMSVHTFYADRKDRGLEMREGLFFTIVGGKISDIDECWADIDAEDEFWSN